MISKHKFLQNCENFDFLPLREMTRDKTAASGLHDAGLVEIVMLIIELHVQ
jgi:hypothetical protein